MKSIRLTFLHASVPLAKTFELQPDKTITLKKAYPLVTDVTSTEVEIDSLRDLYAQLVKHATSKQKHCLLKGELTRPLFDESRKAMCPTDMPTRILMLDLDKAPFTSPAEFMKAIGITDTAYIWQWSSSAKISTSKTISGHVFLILDKPLHPRQIKAWLMNLNFTKDVLKKSLELCNSKASLHWPLDIIVNDNGRIVYIAEPIFLGTKSPIPSAERIQYIKGKKDMLEASFVQECSMEAMKVRQREITNELRVAEGLPSNRTKTKMIGEYEVQGGAGEVTNYQVVDAGGDYVRYNLNGGDSQAYWHPRNSFELLHCFKGEPSLFMKEVMPSRYTELVRQSNQQTVEPNHKGNIIIAFRHKHTNEYWKGTWNPDLHKLDVQTTDSPKVLADFVKQFGGGLSIDEYVPEWEVIFDPTTNEVYDPKKRVLNSFVAPPLMNMEPSTIQKPYPTIQKILNHAIGIGPVQEHFLNWLAVIMQYRTKTMTSWILHGVEGTGKGLLIHRVLRPIFQKYLTTHRASELQQQFNGWMETALLAFIDEIEADVFEKRSMEGDLRNAITEPTIPIRRMRNDVYQAPSYINFIFSSNKPQPVVLPMTDRRFNVGRFQPLRMQITNKEVQETIGREVEAFANYLLVRSADVDKAAAVLQSEDREIMQALSVTSIDEFANDILTGNIMKLWEYMPDEKLLLTHGLLDPNAAAYVQLMKRFINEKDSTISRDELRMMFGHTIGKVPEGANKFTSYLRHHGIHTSRVWDGVCAVYGVKITWKITKEERAEVLQSLQGEHKAGKIRMVK